MTPSPYMTRKEAAAYARVSTKTIDRWIRLGMPATRIGGRVLIRPAALSRWIEVKAA